MSLWFAWSRSPIAPCRPEDDLTRRFYPPTESEMFCEWHGDLLSALWTDPLMARAEDWPRAEGAR